jgi:hypothetical protein
MASTTVLTSVVDFKNTQKRVEAIGIVSGISVIYAHIENKSGILWITRYLLVMVSQLCISFRCIVYFMFDARNRVLLDTWDFRR